MKLYTFYINAFVIFDNVTGKCYLITSRKPGRLDGCLCIFEMVKYYKISFCIL